MARWLSRPAGIEFPLANAAALVTETPTDRAQGALARLADGHGILAGRSEDDIAREAQVPLSMARIELGCLIAARNLMVFPHKDGPVWILPHYEDDAMCGIA